MKRFTFRLEALKRLAAADESLQRIETARREHAVRKCLDHLDECRRVSETARARMQELIDGGRPRPDAVSQAIHQMDDASSFVERAEADVDAAEHEATAARVLLEEHVTRRRVLERLEERARRQHGVEQERLEQREMDETALHRCEEAGA